MTVQNNTSYDQNSISILFRQNTKNQQYINNFNVVNEIVLFPQTFGQIYYIAPIDRKDPPVIYYVAPIDREEPPVIYYIAPIDRGGTTPPKEPPVIYYVAPIDRDPIPPITRNKKDFSQMLLSLLMMLMQSLFGGFNFNQPQNAGPINIGGENSLTRLYPDGNIAY